MPPSRLTPAVRKNIISSIRAGGYPYIAAEAWGIAKRLFDDYLKRGHAEGGRDPYRSFARDVREAFAQARLRAEIKIYTEDPKVWLIHGPGRETDDRPGWSLSVKPAEPTPPESRNALETAEIMETFNLLLKALEPFAEARAAAAKVLADKGIKQVPV